MTQGDPNASPSGSSRSHDITNELLGTNNFFMPDGNNRIQLRTLLPQLHPLRLRDHQVVAFDPKRSSNIPPPPMQEQPECNPTPMDPTKHNPAEIEVNSIEIIAEMYSWKKLANLLFYPTKPIDTSAPVSLH